MGRACKRRCPPRPTDTVAAKLPNNRPTHHRDARCAHLLRKSGGPKVEAAPKPPTKRQRQPKADAGGQGGTALNVYRKANGASNAVGDTYAAALGCLWRGDPKLTLAANTHSKGRQQPPTADIGSGYSNGRRVAPPNRQDKRFCRTISTTNPMKTPTKHTNDQLAIEPPRKVQSILVQSPLPLKIMGMARCRGKFSTMP